MYLNNSMKKQLFLGLIVVEMSISAGYAQLPKIPRRIPANRVSSKVAAVVRQHALTPSERAILPVNGIATHRVFRGGRKDLRVSALFDTQNSLVSEIMKVGQNWKLKSYTPTLSRDLFPKYGKLDEQAVYNASNFIMNNLEKWAEHETEFLKHLQVQVYRDIPWENYLPARPGGFIFMGETHYHPGTYRTIFQALKSLRENNPDLKIIFPTEYVPDTLGKSTFSDHPNPLRIRTEEDLKQALFTKEQMAFDFLKKIMDLDVEVVGIEPQSAVTDAFLKERGLSEMTPQEKDNRYNFARSSAIVIERNKKWVEHLQQLHEQNPDKLIFVHCGATHSSRNILSSVPNLLEGDTFVVQIFPWTELLQVSPAFYWEVVFNNMHRELLELGPRQVFSFKSGFNLLPKEKQELFKTAFGADMVIGLSR